LLISNTIKKYILVFAISLIIRLVYVLILTPESHYIYGSEDSKMYIRIADAIYETGGKFVYDSDGVYKPETERMPIYIYFLAIIKYFAINNYIQIIILLQCIIDSITCVLTGILVQRIFHKHFFFGALLGSINLNMVLSTGFIQTETLFLFIFVLMLNVYFNKDIHYDAYKIVLLGFLLSFGALIKSAFYYLIPLVVIGYILTCRKNVNYKMLLRNTILIILPIILTLGPTHYRNYKLYKSFAFTSQGGGHTMGFLVPQIYQTSGMGSYQEGLDWINGLYNKRLDKIDSMELLNPFRQSEIRMDTAKEGMKEIGLFNMVKAWIIGSAINMSLPSIHLNKSVREMKTASYYRTDGNNIYEKIKLFLYNSNSIKYIILMVVFGFFTVLFNIIKFIGIIIFIKKRKYLDELFVLLLVTLYFIIIAGPVLSARFRIPIEPVLIIYFISGMSSIKYCIINKLNYPTDN